MTSAVCLWVGFLTACIYSRIVKVSVVKHTTSDLSSTFWFVDGSLYGAVEHRKKCMGEVFLRWWSEDCQQQINFLNNWLGLLPTWQNPQNMRTCENVHFLTDFIQKSSFLTNPIRPDNNHHQIDCQRNFWLQEKLSEKELANSIVKTIDWGRNQRSN